VRRALVFSGENVDDYELANMLGLDLRPDVAIIDGLAAASDFFRGCLRGHGKCPSIE
jgi:hypothetical protein